ncbi:unnamed protein product [Spirodela intermedia]|uniref:Non-specific lipid-transfer protein n=2 Tax=Spirodela intermedia TaxID=51605 RepID=A0A7I8JGV1_SPIIN|nr:unnamed protein product [Spirodela intermedia]CAA6668985.1 unnamed protein product [Spirodela intermedia]CAA7405929.1 unnamed protein product [Spirodela intermedia]
MAAGGVRALVAFVVLCLLVAAPCANAAVSCPKVASSIAPCVNYIRGKGPLTPACCNGVRALNSQAKTPADRRATCNCLKSYAGKIPGLNPSLTSGLPGKCGVSVPYPISTKTDCTK